MTSGQVGPTTPTDARTSTSPYGNAEHPFNVPYLAAATGATYVARWTALHVRRLERSIIEAMNKRGFSVVEVISPCPTYYGRWNKMGDTLEQMKHYHDHSMIRHQTDPAEADISLGGEIIVGRFVDEDKPTFCDLLREAVQ
jgi:2-oxoglutarate ferredoxin oxidoreductase subunit beta